MIKSIKLLSIVLTSSFFMTEAFASAASGGGQFQSCQDANHQIALKCSGNPAFAQAQGNRGFLNMFAQGKRPEAAGQQLEGAAGETKTGLLSMSKLRGECSQAASSCRTVCMNEYKAHVDHYNQLVAAQSPDAATFKTTKLDPKKVEAEQTVQLCNSEFEKTKASTGIAMAEMGNILQTALAGLIALKGTNSGGGDSLDPFQTASVDTDDICKQEPDYAKYMPSCNGGGEPIGGSRGAAVSTGVGGLAGDPGAGGDFLTASNDAGAKNPASDNDSGSGFGNFGSAGGIGSGVGGGSGSGSGEGQGNGSGLDSDIHKGFMSAGGAGGGAGFSGGGGSKGGAAPFNAFGASQGKAVPVALNNKLNKLKKAGIGDRKPASAGGANGPFQDNWGVINKAYKKNSSSMFHQK